MSIGLPTGDQVLGALNIYNSSGRPLSDDSDRIARTFAVCAGIVLANADASDDPRAERHEHARADHRRRHAVRHLICEGLERWNRDGHTNVAHRLGGRTG